NVIKHYKLTIRRPQNNTNQAHLKNTHTHVNKAIHDQPVKKTIASQARRSRATDFSHSPPSFSICWTRGSTPTKEKKWGQFLHAAPCQI
ncbi:MAG: hypothetical protein RPU41_10770, partial [Candidatus Sedimenticola sp. (ex Thyasira tokunagai)]